jgi:sugar transferase (PEP-CTERM/EpsH1 system associated)
VRVLFLTHRVPYAPNRGDRVRAFQIVRSLAARAEVELVSLAHDRFELAQTARLEELGVRAAAFLVPRLRNYGAAVAALAGPRPLTHVLLDAPGLAPALKRIAVDRPPDVVLAYCSGMARFAMEPPLTDYPLVLDLVDVDSEKWRAMAAAASPPKRWVFEREVRCLAPFEKWAATRAYATLVVNDRERQSLQRLAPRAAIRVVPNGVDLAGLRPSSVARETPDVIFCGVMNYGPNVEGVLWFAREVWPIIRARTPEARFYVVGSDPSGVVRRLASDRAGIHVTGTVADVREYLWNSAVSVNPLKTARGVQNKVLEAVAAGLPAVVTPPVLEGLPREARCACRVASGADDFAEQTLSLLALSGQERRALAGRADLRGLSWDRQLAPLHDILEAAAIDRAMPLSGPGSH